MSAEITKVAEFIRSQRVDFQKRGERGLPYTIVIGFDFGVMHTFNPERSERGGGIGLIADSAE